MVLTVFVLNLHHIEDRPVPRLVKQIVLFYMAHLLGVNVKDRPGTSCCGRKRKKTSKGPKTRRRRFVGSDGSRGKDKPLTFANRTALYHSAPLHLESPTTMTDITPDACSSTSGGGSVTVLGKNGSNNCTEHITMVRMEPKVVLNGGVDRTAKFIETIENKSAIKNDFKIEPKKMSKQSSIAATDNDSVFLDESFSDVECGGSTDGEDYVPATESHEVPPVDFSRDWKKIAEVFDRLFFWLFLLAIFISTLILFHPLTDSYIKRHSW